jgi:hypothetical protein
MLQADLLFFSAWAPLVPAMNSINRMVTSAGTILVEDQNPGSEGFFPGGFLFGNGSLADGLALSEQYGTETYVYTPTLPFQHRSRIEMNYRLTLNIYPNPCFIGNNDCI